MRNDLDDIDLTVMSLKALVSDLIDTDTATKIEICASEALTNLFKHAKASDRTVPVTLHLAECPDVIILDIFDPVGADPFDIRDHAIALEDVDPFSESGRGLGLIQQNADHVHYGHKAGRMCLTLTFSKSGNLAHVEE